MSYHGMTRLICPILLVGLSSCYSTATLHTARPMQPGKVRTAVAVGALIGEDDGDFDALPTIEGQLRIGLSDRVDGGLHATNFGLLRIDVNWALLLTEDQAVSLNPTAEFSLGTYLWLPVLWDFYRNEDVTLTASLRPGRYWLDFDDNDDSGLLDGLEFDAWLYGVGLAAEIRVAEQVALAPELRVVWSDPEGGQTIDPIVSLSFGVIF